MSAYQSIPNGMIPARRGVPTALKAGLPVGEDEGIAAGLTANKAVGGGLPVTVPRR